MKVCFVSCQYPPLSRTLRRYKFARFLKDGGCDIEVVAHGNISHALGTFLDDPGLCGDDPDIRVHRPRAFPWYLMGEALYRTGAVPCPYINWLRPAISTARKIARSPGDVVLGIYPPLTNLLSAWRVSRHTGARLVLDFRDEYLGLAKGMRVPWATWCEKRLVDEASLISVATEKAANNLVERYGLPEERVHLTENGFWDEVTDEKSYPSGDKVRIVYAGALSPAQGIEVLFQSIEILKRTFSHLAERIEVEIFGPENLYLRQKLLPLTGKGIRYGGFLEASKVSAALLRADVLFLSLASEDFSYAVPGKLYEYISHARPILGALPQGRAREIIEEGDFGLVAPCGNPEELAKKMAEMVDGKKRLCFHRNLVARKDEDAARPYFLSLARRIQEIG